MSRKRVFEPVVSTFMATDGVNHAPDVLFKISYGFELENPNPVFKVQMVQGDLLKGRQAPSYSDHDFEKIVQVRESLKQVFDETDKRKRDRIIAVEDLLND